MRERIMCGAVLLLLPLVVVVHGRWDAPLGLQTKPAATDQDRNKLLATGQKIFVERCAKCHDERGDKPLKTGLPLSQRELSDEEIVRRFRVDSRTPPTRISAGSRST